MHQKVGESLFHAEQKIGGDSPQEEEKLSCKKGYTYENLVTSGIGKTCYLLLIHPNTPWLFLFLFHDS